MKHSILLSIFCIVCTAPVFCADDSSYQTPSQNIQEQFLLDLLEKAKEDVIWQNNNSSTTTDKNKQNSEKKVEKTSQQKNKKKK